jgi:choline dehydrogenase-like flavoprotein
MATEMHDILIVGSSHAGGAAAHVLTQQGFKVLMLNAGPMPDLDRDREDRPTALFPYRNFIPPRAVNDMFINGELRMNAFTHPDEVPYSHDKDKPYIWVRNRLVGGRSLFWGRRSFRLSDLEFKCRDHDGHGENWPVDLKEMAPFYSAAEAIMRVTGRRENLAYFPDNDFAVEDDSSDHAIFQTINTRSKRGFRISKERVALGVEGMASSFNLFLPQALKTGRLALVPDAVVRQLSVDRRTGLVDGAHYVERQTGREVHVRARVVVLAAGTLESVRILLNSGLANSSGVLGRYLIDQMYANTAVALAPPAMRGATGRGLLVPFENAKVRNPAFLRRYAVSLTACGDPTPDMFTSFGAALDEDLKRHRGAMVTGQFFGEVLPEYANHARLNKDVVDRWGIPTLHLSCAYGDNEVKMHRASQDLIAEMFDEAELEVWFKDDTRREPGQSIHEIGGCRMGDDPKKSVLDRWNVTHDVRNLLVVDGGAFVSGGWQNPTLTIVALSMRAAGRLATQLKKGAMS